MRRRSFHASQLQKGEPIPPCLPHFRQEYRASSQVNVVAPCKDVAVSNRHPCNQLIICYLAQL